MFDDLADGNHWEAPSDAVEASERRVGKRHSIVLLIGRVRRGAQESVCLVHDISQFGLMARFTVAPVMGETLWIEVRGLEPIVGTVRWVRGAKAGFEFQTPQPFERAFKVKRDDGTTARSPRFPMEKLARMRLAATPFSASVLDISPGGAKLVSETRVVPRQTGQIILPETGTSIFGTVCWAREDRFGFRFVAPLPLATLALVLGS